MLTDIVFFLTVTMTPAAPLTPASIPRPRPVEEVMILRSFAGPDAYDQCASLAMVWWDDPAAFAEAFPVVPDRVVDVRCEAIATVQQEG